MPYIRLEANRRISDRTAKELTAEITDIVHEEKPEVLREGIAVVITKCRSVGFGGDAEAPAAVMTVTNAKMPHKVTLPLSKRLTAAVEKHCGIPPARFYIFFHEYLAPHLVAIRGMTFVELAALLRPASDDSETTD